MIYILKLYLLPKDIRMGVGGIKLAKGTELFGKWSDLGRLFVPTGSRFSLLAQRHQAAPQGKRHNTPPRLRDT